MIGGVNSTMIHCKNFFNVMMYTQGNNNIIKKVKINIRKRIWLSGNVWLQSLQGSMDNQHSEDSGK
jgi:hypothetical protein